MNFRDAEAYLLSLGNEVETMKLGLGNIRKLLAALGDPQNNYLKVQVAGTNGKGSVCAFLDSICLETGIKTGVFTSPHLVSITERVRVNGIDISEDDFARHSTLVRETAERMVTDDQLEYTPTFFEQVTAIALIAFADANVELAILETGLGGRLDATTAANAEITAITRIDLDHQEYLGETIEEIAAEKAAIIRKSSLVCVGFQKPEALKVIVEACVVLNVKPTTLENAHWSGNYPGVDLFVDEFRGEEVVLSLEGDHQIENGALAILLSLELRKFFAISDAEIALGLGRARHPGRLEWLKDRPVQVLLDGAHNQAGSEALAAYLKSNYSGASIALVYAAMEDKDFISMLEPLSPIVTDLILTEPKNARVRSAVEIAEAARTLFGRDHIFVVPDVESALDSAIQLAETYPGTKFAFVLVTGSLYLVGEIKQLLKSQI